MIRQPLQIASNIPINSSPKFCLYQNFPAITMIIPYIIMHISSLILTSILLPLFLSLRVDPSNSLFVDQYGRYRVYHGVNAVYKIYPFHPDLTHFNTNYSLTDHDFYNLKHWGMNAIRLHCSWQGLEPERGVYNYTYLETLRQIVRMADKHGIAVLLDAHQDLFVKQFCGEGLPTWTVKRESFPAPLKVKLRYDDKGFPLTEDCLKTEFGKFYLTYDVMKLQKDLFTNQRGLLDSFVKFWEIVAAYMSEEPNLLGYEFINEPMGYDAYVSPGDTLLPGSVNNKYLLPAYKRIYQAIRKNDKKGLIFFEPSTVDIFGGSFFETPGGEQELDKQVLSYHVYCPYVTPLGEPKSGAVCKTFDTLQVQSKQQNIRQLKIGGFMTQYGALSGTISSAQQVTRLTDLMEMNFRSWTYWQFKYYHDITTAANPGTTESFYDENGGLQVNKVKALARPYAYAICGQPLQQTFRKGILTLNWVASECYNMKTELYLSDNFYFPAGKNVKFSKNCRDCQLVLAKGEAFDFYQVWLGGKAEGKRISLTISPK